VRWQFTVDLASIAALAGGRHMDEVEHII
jgi:hypothetical protein